VTIHFELTLVEPGLQLGEMYLFYAIESLIAKRVIDSFGRTELHSEQ